MLEAKQLKSLINDKLKYLQKAQKADKKAQSNV